MKITSIQLILIAALAVSAGSVYAAEVAGPHTPTAVTSISGSGTAAWENVTNVFSSDDAGAAAFATELTDVLEVSNFGFSIPSDATVTGIEVGIEGHSAFPAHATEQQVQLLKAGSVTGENKANSVLPFTYEGMDTVVSHGSSTDLWGAGWTPDDINSSDFGVAAQWGNLCSGICLSSSAVVDTVTVTVSYEPASSTPSWWGKSHRKVKRVSSSWRGR